MVLGSNTHILITSTPFLVSRMSTPSPTWILAYIFQRYFTLNIPQTSHTMFPNPEGIKTPLSHAWTHGICYKASNSLHPSWDCCSCRPVLNSQLQRSQSANPAMFIPEGTLYSTSLVCASHKCVLGFVGGSSGDNPTGDGLPVEALNRNMTQRGQAWEDQSWELVSLGLKRLFDGESIRLRGPQCRRQQEDAHGGSILW